ncbi:hypothetical protein AYL99_11692 [Fonsecaea erecta]|uniref:Uncharacterized protein n=1 Tax=Fonsecaea erecta TaxID=1367422 RepID=A0A178Z354_9EURO|nr:hypothetical protein AYL99_11692 [Fonsecaea erecta]OAP54157.1 hypothetical protein AYL99_11692 [Fonsecaea erecta]
MAQDSPRVDESGTPTRSNEISVRIGSGFGDGPQTTLTASERNKQNKRKGDILLSVGGEQTTKKNKSGELSNELSGSAKEIHDQCPPLEVSNISQKLQQEGKDVGRDLGIFLEGDLVILKLRGRDIPAADADSAEVNLFKSALAAALMLTENKHPAETWWRWAAQQIDMFLRNRETCDGETAVDIRELLRGTRRRDGDERPRGEQDDTPQTGEGQENGKLARQYPKSMNMPGGGKALAPRGSKSLISTKTPIEKGMALKGRKKVRRPLSEVFPTLPFDHPNQSKVVTKAQLYAFIKEYPTQKQKRHELLPKYFNPRGYLYLQGIGKELVSEWVTRMEVVVNTGAAWPEDLLSRTVMSNILAWYSRTVAHYSTNNAICKGVRRAKLEERRDPNTGRFLNTDHGVRPFDDLGVGRTQTFSRVQSTEIKYLQKGQADERMKRERRDRMLSTLHQLLVGDIGEFLAESEELMARDAEELDEDYAEIARLWMGI